MPYNISSTKEVAYYCVGTVFVFSPLLFSLDIISQIYKIVLEFSLYIQTRPFSPQAISNGIFEPSAGNILFASEARSWDKVVVHLNIAPPASYPNVDDFPECVIHESVGSMCLSAVVILPKIEDPDFN